MRNAPTSARRNGYFLVSATNGRLTRRLKFPVVSTYLKCMNNQHQVFSWNMYNLYNNIQRATTYIHLGHSECCQQLRMSSDVKVWYSMGDAMGDYDYYANDPDGARIYYNSRAKLFITRFHISKNWVVS